MKTSITFFGTPEFAVPTLKALLNADFCDVSLVVTQPDKPVGRHHSKPIPSPVKRIAQEAGIPVIPSEAEGSGAIADEIPRLASTLARNDGLGLGVLVAYGEIIPKEIIDAFPLGILNIHPSLLPKYRGSSPIQAAIRNLDEETGVTLMKLDDQMDHGPIVAQEKFKIPPPRMRRGQGGGLTAGDLHDTLALLGTRLLIRTLPDYIAGRIKPRPQDDTKASYTEKLTKEDGRIDWSKTPDAIQAHIRAMNPWPGAWTMWKGKKLIIWRAALVSSRASDSEARNPLYAPNTHKGSLAGARDKNTLQLHEVQLEGKKRMLFGEFKRGHPDFKLR